MLYIIYLVFAFDLGSKAKWPFGKLLWVLISGTIPTAAFFVERKVSREVEPLIADGRPGAPPRPDRPTAATAATGRVRRSAIDIY